MRGKEVAEFLEISKQNLYSYLRRGRLKAIKDSRNRYIYDEDSVYKLKGEIEKKRISKLTKAVLKENNARVVFTKVKKPKKYDREIIRIADPEGYNFLENYHIVRRYIQKKNNIDHRTLELLFFLYPKKLFSWYDYQEYPLSFSHHRIETLIKKGFIEVFRKDKMVSRQIYRTTKKTAGIVRSFYEYLSGERKLPINGINNPLMKKAKNHREEVIQKMIVKFHKDMNVPWFDPE